MYHVYIIQNVLTGKHYTGSTKDLERRLREHNKNQVKTTKHKSPYTLVYSEQLSTRTEAIKRENQIKQYKGNNKFKRLLKT